MGTDLASPEGYGRTGWPLILILIVILIVIEKMAEEWWNAPKGAN